MAEATPTIRVKPAPDRRVRWPDGRLLDAKGDDVPETPYWIRKVNDEDVVVLPPKAKKDA